MSEENHFDIDRIKEAVKIWDVMNHFGHEANEVCRAIKSPLREERSPSFSIFADGDMAKDHGTGESFDCILLYEALANCNRHEAIVGCGKLAGLTPREAPPELHVPAPPRSKPLKTEKAKKPVEGFRSALPPYDDAIRHTIQNAAYDDLRGKRGILTNFCAIKGIKPHFMEEMVRQGLVGVLTGHGLRTPAIAWQFFNPIYGHGCKLRLSAESSHSTMWWEGKGQEHFFGEQIMLPRKSDSKMIVTEGESDTLTLLSMGVDAVGVPGASIIPCYKVTHLILAYRRIATVYDQDPAGIKAAKKIQQHLAKHASGSQIFYGIMDKIPDGMDIGDCYDKWPERFSKYVQDELDRMEIFNEHSIVSEN